MPPPAAAAAEPVPTTPLSAPDPNARLAALVASLGEHGLSVVATSNVNRPTVRDYHWAYSNGEGRGLGRGRWQAGSGQFQGGGGSSRKE